MVLDLQVSVQVLLHLFHRLHLSLHHVHVAFQPADHVDIHRLALSDPVLLILGLGELVHCHSQVDVLALPFCQFVFQSLHIVHYLLLYFLSVPLLL